MVLAHMIATDNDALICDMAQYYNIYDYERLPVDRAAVLAFGLPDDSRIKRILTGQQYSIDTLLTALCADHLAVLCWSKTKQAQKGRGKPESIFGKLTEKKKEPELKGFNTPGAFEAYRRHVIEVNNNGK